MKNEIKLNLLIGNGVVSVVQQSTKNNQTR